MSQAVDPNTPTFRPIWSFQSEQVLGKSYGQRWVYAVLWSYANKNYICWPGEKSIVERTGIERTCLSKMISQLEKQGIIAVHRCITGKTAKGNCYDLIPNLGRNRGQIKELMDPLIVNSGTLLEMSNSELSPTRNSTQEQYT